MIDFHTHLDLYPDPIKVAEETNRLNGFTLAVTTSPRAWQATSKHFERFDKITVALGLHPEIATEKSNEIEILFSIISMTRFIGEIGLDGSSKYSASYSIQKKLFEEILRECAKVGNRILSIHSRSSASDVIGLLAKYPTVGKSVLHWFTGTQKELRQAIDLGCWFSVGPAMMKSKNGRLLVSNMPKERILPESDGPFVIQSNKPIMPWQAMSIVRDLSEIWDISISETEEIIRQNLKQILT